MSGTFVKLATLDELAPGTMKCAEISGRCILLANVGGNYYATDDTCTHEDASLSNGFLEGVLVKCPLHGSRFDLRTGKVLEDPAEENLTTYRVKVEDDAVWVDPGLARKRENG